jgi:hypothetical protein
MPSATLLYLPILVRDLVQAGVAGHLMFGSRVVVAGASWHRLFSLSVAVGGMYILLTGTTPALGAVVVYAIGVVTLIDYVLQARALSLGRISGTHPQVIFN